MTWFKILALLLSINGPETAEPGDPVLFTSELKESKWEVYPDQATNGKVTYISTSDGSLVFCTYPGTYVIFNSGLSEDGKVVTSKKVFHVGGNPVPPKPIPPPDPPALVKLIRDNLKLSDDEKPSYLKLAAFFKDPQVTDISQLQPKTKETTNSILADTTKWKVVMTNFIAPYLKQQNVAGDLQANLLLWEQIGEGITEACK